MNAERLVELLNKAAATVDPEGREHKPCTVDKMDPTSVRFFNEFVRLANEPQPGHTMVVVEAAYLDELRDKAARYDNLRDHDAQVTSS